MSDATPSGLPNITLGPRRKMSAVRVRWPWGHLILSGVAALLFLAVVRPAGTDRGREPFESKFFGVMGFDEFLSLRLADGPSLEVGPPGGWSFNVLVLGYAMAGVFSLLTALTTAVPPPTDDAAPAEPRAEPGPLMLSAALAFPVAFVLLGMFVAWTTSTGTWTSWVFRDTGLVHIHRGARFMPPRYAVTLGVPVLAGLIAWAFTASLSVGLKRGRLVAVVTMLALLGAVFVSWFAARLGPVALPPPSPLENWHVICASRTRDLCAITPMVWCVMALILWLAVRLTRWAEARLMIPAHLCPRCRYDLRGSLAAGRTQCPECGTQVSPVALAALPKLDGSG